MTKTTDIHTAARLGFTKEAQAYLRGRPNYPAGILPWLAGELGLAVGKPALAEIRRVLRPGGKLGMVWNVRDESVDWVAAITKIVTPYEGDAPRFYKGDWRKPFAKRAHFGAMTQTSLDHRHEGPAQQVILDRFMSVSFIATLPAPERVKIAARLRALIDCPRRLNIDPPCRSNIDPGRVAAF